MTAAAVGETAAAISVVMMDTVELMEVCSKCSSLFVVGLALLSDCSVTLQVWKTTFYHIWLVVQSDFPIVGNTNSHSLLAN